MSLSPEVVLTHCSQYLMGGEDAKECKNNTLYSKYRPTDDVIVWLID